MKYHLSCKIITTPADHQGPGTDVCDGDDEFDKPLIVTLKRLHTVAFIII
jgi:hypothetical protein